MITIFVSIFLGMVAGLVAWSLLDSASKLVGHWREVRRQLRKLQDEGEL